MIVDIILPSNVAGGAERVAINLANCFVKKNIFKLRLILLAQKNREYFYPINEDIKIIEVGGSLKLLKIIKLFKLYINSKPNCIISFLDIAIFYGILIKTFFNVNLIISERNNPYQRKGNYFLDFINPRLYFLADKIALQTNAIKNTFNHKLQKKIIVIPNPVNLPEKKWKVEAFDKKKIIAIGRLEHQKGFDLLIKAFSIFNEKASEWNLTIVGDGSQKSKLKELTINLDLTNKIKFISSRKNIESLYLNNSIYILTSRFEGFPNTLLEAQSYGIPCIATNCDYGPSEIIKNDYNGILITSNSTNSISAALNKMIKYNKDQLLSISRNSIDRSKKYNIATISQEWLSIITDENRNH